MTDAVADPVGTASERVPQVLSVQYLRGVAAMAVVVFHVQLGLDHFNGNGAVATSHIGAAGVDLFFVISGFIMCHISAVRPLPAARFLEARLLRVVPLYWLATLAMFLMPLVSKTVGWSSTLDPRHLLASLFFVGGIVWPGTGNDFPVYRAGWTIDSKILLFRLRGGARRKIDRQRRAALLRPPVCPGVA